MAVSPESMQASAPSRMALATSVTSARVGIRECCMLSSICVAMITGLRCRWQTAMIRFCTTGTVGDVDLDAQVAAGDHHGVGGLDDLFEVLEGLGLFDLGDDLGLGPFGRDRSPCS